MGTERLAEGGIITSNTAATAGKVSQGRPQKPGAEDQVSERALRAIPQLEVSVVIRAGEQLFTEKFSVPLLVTPDTAREFAQALGRHFTDATNRAIGAYTRKMP